MSVSNRPASSWKKLALGLPAFLLLLFLFDRGLFSLFRVIERKSFTLSLLEDKLRAVPDPSGYEVLALGSSRAFDAFIPKFVNPEIGSRMFREASKGKGPKYNYYFYRMYRETVGIPKVVVYGVDYFVFGLGSLAPLLQSFPESRDIPQTASPGVSLLLANKNRVDQFINEALNRFQEKIHLGPQKVDPEKNVADMEAFAGESVFDPSHVVTEIPADFESKRSAYSPYPGEEGMYFSELLRELKKDGVAILLVTIPDHVGTFRTYRDYGRFLQEQRDLVRNLDYEGRGFFFDYNSPSLFPTDDRDCFLNGGYGVANSHLSAKGAEIYCRMLARDIKKILETMTRP